jgi:uncharacterized protein YndB with AHSA1/START domain
MSEVSRVVNCSPEAVFDVLSDGWSYATWVVGAARIRSVDKDFPAPGSRIHHSVGIWPFMLSDHTEVERYDPPHEIQLLARAWPAGEARVTLICEPQGEQTKIIMRENVVKGPAKLIPRAIEEALITARNREALLRLGFLAERGARTHGSPVNPGD